jgi:hypothetical protein
MKIKPAVAKADSQYRHLQSILNFADIMLDLITDDYGFGGLSIHLQMPGVVIAASLNQY